MKSFTASAYAASIIALALNVAAASVAPNPTGIDLGKLLPKEQVSLIGGWSQNGVPDPETVLNLQIGLKQKDIAGAIAKLHDVSDPKSPNYGKWLTQEEIAAYTTAEPATVAAVKQWLKLNGISDKSINQTSPDWLEVNIPIVQAESLLHTKYSLFTHPSAPSQPLPRALTYSLPESLHSLIDTIQPTTALIVPIAPKIEDQGANSPVQDSSQGASGSSRLSKRDTTCDPYNLTPDCLRAYYQVDWSPTNHAGAQLASAGIGNAPANHTDAHLYYFYFGAFNGGFNDIAINSGPFQNGQANLEGNLDTQLTGGIAKGNQAYYLNIGNPNSDSFIDLSNYLANERSAPPSVSISYGANEAGLSGSYMTRVWNGFATAGLKGISILAATGDGGVSGVGDSSQSCTKFQVTFPANCPYVTAVGGTDFRDGAKFTVGKSSNTEEAAWFGSTGGTSGGFSNYFGLPDYQKQDVQAYVRSLNGQYNGLYNMSGRAYPDVSALAQSWFVFYNGNIVNGVVGTSASAPAWAALVSILNDYRLSSGKATLGFLNPLLYGQLKASVRDVSGRGTRGCNGAGFPATSGWDAATGLGSPLFDKIRANLP